MLVKRKTTRLQTGSSWNGYKNKDITEIWLRWAVIVKAFRTALLGWNQLMFIFQLLINLKPLKPAAGILLWTYVFLEQWEIWDGPQGNRIFRDHRSGAFSTKDRGMFLHCWFYFFDNIPHNQKKIPQMPADLHVLCGS